MGSLGNMAPEVIEFKPYGLAADMFSLGSMFYQLLFGNYPFPADSYTSFLNQAKTGT
jgi:serine/threonine protein kinase